MTPSHLTTRLFAAALLATVLGCSARGQGALAGVRFTPRQEWGAQPVGPGARPHRITHITIHHTATRQRPDRPLGDKLRALQAFSQSESALADGRLKPAWADIPYHFYVADDGTVAEGRPLRFAGDSNTSYDPAGHLLIVLEGNFEEERPTAAQVDALRRLVRGFARAYDVPAEHLGAHRDYASTACPGDHLYALLPDLRDLLTK